MKKDAKGREQSRKTGMENRQAPEHAAENKKTAQPTSRKAPEEMK